MVGARRRPGLAIVFGSRRFAVIAGGALALLLATLAAAIAALA